MDILKVFVSCLTVYRQPNYIIDGLLSVVVIWIRIHIRIGIRNS